MIKTPESADRSDAQMPQTREAARREAGDSETLADVIADAALSRRARDVTLLDLRGMATFTDYFVLCTATSDTHAEGIANVVRDQLEAAGVRLWHAEGVRGASWILLDYVAVVAHIFVGEARQFYDLERLWADAPSTVLEDDELADITEDEDAGTFTHYTAMDDLADDDNLKATGHDDREE